MRKAIALLVLAVGLGVVATPGPAPVDAQDKTKTKEDSKAKSRGDAKDKRGGHGTIEIYQAKDGYRYRVKDAEGKTIAMPPRGHETRQEILKVIEEVKAILDKEKPTEVKE